ncbi:hsp70 cofactor [Mesoplasma florum L1]|uniref:Protein GrpE n=2 Tax=Mesoplasma florum TaxID=2151 RepID=GRPE_MESFL|nr:nucleotide exchange factor GrpE [Mesoplasma florum]Q6F148.1 RecName: Full=Protein GrpE; AltName: Full=HSP-70 cofactor [Mesoplasma florum L1]AAT75775.1 hsp70 cofactor [Mesoplasma florum L1]AGY41508.1 Heat shock protein GrpE [Mesoplasma florum W37]ATI73376.1 nucleotide exchange factor GrpE [Mesoplasma florum]ATI74057.1 nucleotide exchange factor GrpE [Mesoplasma florum]AVN59034.1 nucleotide exchange factor GrpE [Mesoplasma florum]
MNNEKELKKEETSVENKEKKVATEEIKKEKKDYKKIIQDLEKQIESCQKEIEFQKSLRNADIANLTKKRNEQEALVRKYGSSNLAEDLIKPIDLLKKVVETPTDIPELQNYLMGFKMIISQIENAFETNGIKAMGVKAGDEFDSSFHEANESLENSGMESNKIVSVISDGYMIHDRVLIHAIVKVAK